MFNCSYLPFRVCRVFYFEKNHQQTTSKQYMSIDTGDDVVNTVSWLLEFRQGRKRLCRHFKYSLSETVRIIGLRLISSSQLSQ